MNTLAIKLGSSYTSIFKQGEGIVLFEPTLVAYSGTGESLIVKAVGKDAKKMQGRTDMFTSVKSPIKEGRIENVELASIMLNSFLNKVLTRSVFGKKPKVVVCVPLGLTLKEEKTFEKVFMQCGIHDFKLVPSIVCGARGYGLPINKPVGVCVVNIGGGSTDIAILSANEIVLGINIGIGGNTLDEAIEQHILDKCGLKIGEGVAEGLKREIGSLYANDLSNTELSGIDRESQLAKSIVVDSRIVFEAIEPLYKKIAESIKTVIYSAPPNLVEDVMNNGIFVMGGASLITGAEQYFRKFLNTTITIQDETTAIDVIGALL